MECVDRSRCFRYDYNKEGRKQVWIGPQNSRKAGRDEARINGLGSLRLFVFGKDDEYVSDRQRLRNYLESHENSEYNNMTMKFYIRHGHIEKQFL